MRFSKCEAVLRSLFFDEASEAAEQKHIRVIVRIRPPPSPMPNKANGAARLCLKRHSLSVISYDGPRHSRSVSPPHGRALPLPVDDTPQTPARLESAHTSPPRSGASSVVSGPDSGGAEYRSDSGLLHPSHTRGHRGTWFGTYSPTSVAHAGSSSPPEEAEPTRSSAPDTASSRHTQQFRFDHVLWSVDPSHPQFASQEVVYKACGSLAVSAALRGISATVMAFGPSGCGRSYTMLGDAQQPGLALRLAADLSRRLAQSTAWVNAGGTLHLSMMEVRAYPLWLLKVEDCAEWAICRSLCSAALQRPSARLTGSKASHQAGPPRLRACVP